MPLIQTGDIAPDSAWAPGAQHQTYCGLDCCVTLEVLGAIRGQLDGRPNAARIYGFEKALQAPYLAIMERGFRVDEHGRRRAAEALRGRISALQQTLNTLAEAVWDKGLNPRSPKQLAEFLYGACRLPEVHISQKGIRRLSTNREALEKLDSYIHTRPIISAILLIRDLGKQLQVFEQEIDSDGRFRASYNIAGTECISGDSLIWTKGGLRRIDEIYKSPFPVQVWNGNSWVYPARKVCYPGAKGIKLTLENGYSLRCTLNHEVMTENGWVQAQNLHLGNRVELTIGLGEFSGQHAMPRGGSISQMSEDFCEFYGMILADGSLDTADSTTYL